MQIGARLWGKVLVSHRNRAIKAIQCPFFVTLAPLSLEAEKQASKCYLIQSCLFPTIKLLIQILSSNSMLTTFTLHLFFIRFISPCRSLCESVRDSCAPIMSCYGYPWPEILRCDQYPADHLMCISSITNSTVHTGGRRGKKLTNYTHMLELTQFIKKNDSVSGFTISVPQASCRDCELEEASSSKDTLETFCRSDFGKY